MLFYVFQKKTFINSMFTVYTAYGSLDDQTF